MPQIKLPLQSYDVSGDIMKSGGLFLTVNVVARFEHMSLEDLVRFEEFLKSQGWMG
jgi:hypothetical protein